VTGLLSSWPLAAHLQVEAWHPKGCWLIDALTFQVSRHPGSLPDAARLPGLRIERLLGVEGFVDCRSYQRKAEQGNDDTNAKQSENA